MTDTDNIETILARWTNAEEIRLRAGEIDPDTMRDVLAVTNGMAREIQRALKENENLIKRLYGALGGADAELSRLRKLVKEK